MKPFKPDQWDLYRWCFQDKQEVCLIDSDDRVYFGKLETTEDAAVLSHGGGTITVPWVQCRFICHDGFPYRKLREKFNTKTLVERLAKRNVAQVVRNVLDRDLPEDVAERVRYLVFGDPFEITKPVNARIFNPGNVGWKWWMRDYEECVILTADDGAKAQLFDLKTVLHWEGEA